MKIKRYLIILVSLTILIQKLGAQEDATSIVKKANEKFTGEKSSISTMTMEIIRPTWKRTISFKSWSKGSDLSMVLITYPAKEKGQAFLKRRTEMWNWTPSINRMIKLPPSMLSQGWMGSDVTNDDLLNQTSIVEDYYHKIVGKEVIENKECYKIELTPREESAVVWGKVILWISTKDYLILKGEYYDEDNKLVRTEIAGEIKNMDGRILPTKIEVIPADKTGQKTVLVINEIKFNVPIDDAFFSLQNLRNLK